jgi:DNA primase
LPAGQDPDEVIIKDRQSWQVAVEKAVPVIEYTIRMITARLDLRSSQGKTEAVNRILPVIAGVKAGPRQYQYLTRLAVAVGIDEKRLEAALGRYKADRKARETGPLAVQRATRTIRSSPVEEYLLALLLQHPELKARSHEISGNYFESSENRVIFDIWQVSEDPAVMAGSLDAAVQEHLNSLIARQLPGDQIEERYADCVLRLRERYLRNLKRKHEEALALEAESGDTSAVLARLQEQGIEINEELKKIFDSRMRS